MLDIRPPGEDDREGIAAVGGLAFNMVAQPESVVLSGRRYLCAYDGGRVVATSHSIPFGQWLGARRVPCAGIGGVAVLPEYRGQGVAGALLSELLVREREAGMTVSALYPANAALYRKWGYEYAGLHPGFRASITDIPPSRAEVTELEPSRISEVIACFSAFAAAHNGPVQPVDPARWPTDVLAHPGEGAHPRTVVVPGAAGGVDGYASYFLEGAGDGYRVACKHLVALTAPALSALLGHFRRFENAARELAWFGPPGGGPAGLALNSSAFNLVPALNRWMGRILDVPRALEGRGYADVSGELVLEVHDPLFADNSGPWLVRARAGQVTVAPAPPTGTRALPVGLFSALYTGLASPQDLVLLGALDRSDERLALMSALFAGPVPWMPDFF